MASAQGLRLSLQAGLCGTSCVCVLSLRFRLFPDVRFL
jgi:hypothetical protein